MTFKQLYTKARTVPHYEGLSPREIILYRNAWRNGYRHGAASVKKTVKQVYKYKHDTPPGPVINNHKIVQDIFTVVTKTLKVSKAEVLGHSRHQYLVIPRSMIANLIRECTTLSYPEVARTLNRDHTSILHYIKTRLTQTTFWKTHPYYNQQYNVLKKEILDGNKQ